MIGKVMAEAAHSIIGMLSAKPDGMEQKASHLDFGSLLRSPEQPSHSVADATAIDGEMPDHDELATVDPAAVPNWSAQIAVPATTQNIGLGPWSRPLSSGTAEQQPAADEVDAFAPPGSIDGRRADGKPSIGAEFLTQGDGRKGMTFDARDQLVQGETRAADDDASGEPEESKLAGRVPSLAFPAPLATSETARPLAAALSPLMAKPADPSPTEDEAATAEPKLPAKAMDIAANPLPLTSFAINPAVRETVQGAASFDLSAPRLAERLAAEISELSASGETKKFEINPRNLGRMEIIFTVRGSTEIVEIQTENRAAKDIIMQHSQLLQDMLKAQGREDLSFRVDVKDNMSAFAKTENGNLFQQDSRDAREQQARSGLPGRTLPAFDGAQDGDSASDNSRYA